MELGDADFVVILCCYVVDNTSKQSGIQQRNSNLKKIRKFKLVKHVWTFPCHLRFIFRVLANQTQCEQCFIPFRSHFIPAWRPQILSCSLMQVLLYGYHYSLLHQRVGSQEPLILSLLLRTHQLSLRPQVMIIQTLPAVF